MSFWARVTGAAGALRRRTSRGSAEVGTVVVGAALIVGALVGNGMARTSLGVSDGLTWLADDERGEVVEVNPTTGKPQTRLRLSDGGGHLEITQKDGRLVVLDRRTGQVTVIDLATLLASGRRTTTPGDASKVLVAAGRMYLVDRSDGVVRRVDPVTLYDIGVAWDAGTELADAVADERGTVWAMDAEGTLHALAWSDPAARFIEKDTRKVRGAGKDSVLVPHTQGVTVLGPEGGVVIQEGTGNDLAAPAPGLRGPVLAATTSPADLVPASSPEAGTVVILAGDQVLEVDTRGLGCARPGRPAVFRSRVYVPCLGAGKVIVLDRTGHRGGPDVRVPGSGDPDLVVDDGRLVISPHRGDKGVIVEPDGSTRTFAKRSPDLPVTDPDRKPLPEVPTPPRPSPPPDRPGYDKSPKDPRGQNPDRPGSRTSAGSASPAPDGAPGAPPGVTARLVSRTASDVVVSVSWSAPEDNGDPVTGYSVVGSGSFTGGSRTATATTTTTQLTLPCAGSTFCDGGELRLSVTAENAAGRGAAGTGTYRIPRQAAPTTGAPPPTTAAPPPTTAAPPPPPPPSTPTAGATVITGSRKTSYFEAELTLTPPSDWRNHDGRCEVVNTTYDYAVDISCTAGSVSVGLEEGGNRFVVRAHARDGSRSVDSAPRSVFVRPQDDCGGTTGRICPIQPRSYESVSYVTEPMLVGGIGLIGAGLLLRLRRRFSDNRGETDR